VSLLPKRALCAQCLRPQSSCICQWVRPIAHQVQVLVLQHPLEVANAKGSARLLCISLAHSRLVTGEAFDEAELNDLLNESWPGEVAEAPPRQTVLLYPATPLNPAPSWPLTGDDAPTDPRHLRLVVLDGTWRKSRKMLHLNPVLQTLPRLALRDRPPSNYRIRKAHLPDQLSTLEATCAALGQLESSDAPFEPLLQAFDGFVAQQMAYRLL
jgi:DTW domain-containing protein YfiP